MCIRDRHETDPENPELFRLRRKMEEVIEKYGMAEEIGVAILHKHFFSQRE